MFHDVNQYYWKLGIIKFLNHIIETETPIQRLYIKSALQLKQNQSISKIPFFQKCFIFKDTLVY